MTRPNWYATLIVAAIAVTMWCIGFVVDIYHNKAANAKTRASKHNALETVTPTIPGNVTALAWSPNGRELAFGTADGDVHLWWSPTIESASLWRKKDVTTAVTAIAWHSKGEELATGTEDGNVHVWRPGKPINQPVSFLIDTKPITGLAYEPNGKRLAYTTRGGVLRMVNTHTRYTVYSRPSPALAPLESVSWYNGVLVTGGGRAIQWNPNSGKAIRTLYGSDIRGVDYVICSNYEQNVTGIERETGDILFWKSPEQKPEVLAFAEPVMRGMWLNRPRTSIGPVSGSANITWQEQVPCAWYALADTELFHQQGIRETRALLAPKVTAVSWNDQIRTWAIGTTEGVVFWPKQPY